MRRKCEICKKLFSAVRKGHRFCSYKCNIESYKLARREKYEMVAQRACAQCGTLFKAAPTRVRGPLSQKFCKDRCARDYRNKNRSKNSSAELKLRSVAKAEAMASAVPAETAAYFAGLIDGEGTVRLYTSKNGNHGGQLRVTVGMTVKRPIEEFHRLFGGSAGTYQRPGKGWKAMYRCDLQSWNAYASLLAIMPYMRVKKEHARLGIEFQMGRTEMRGSRAELHPEIMKRRQHYFDKFKKLNS